MTINNFKDLKVLENDIELKSLGNFNLLEEIIDTILEENLKFTIKDYLKSIFYCKNKNRILYHNAIENLDSIMDVERYFKFNIDMTLVKEVLFDETQRNVFDTVTKLLNIKRFFEKKKEVKISFLNYKKENFEHCFEGVKTMFSRNNNSDNRIIKFIEKILEN